MNSQQPVSQFSSSNHSASYRKKEQGDAFSPLGKEAKAFSTFFSPCASSVSESQVQGNQSNITMGTNVRISSLRPPPLSLQEEEGQRKGKRGREEEIFELNGEENFHMEEDVSLVLSSLQQTWGEIGLSSGEQVGKWREFLQYSLKPLLQHWVMEEEEIAERVIRVNDSLLQQLLWLALQLQEEPASASLATLLHAIKRELVSDTAADGEGMAHPAIKYAGPCSQGRGKDMVEQRSRHGGGETQDEVASVTHGNILTSFPLEDEDEEEEEGTGSTADSSLRNFLRSFPLVPSTLSSSLLSVYTAQLHSSRTIHPVPAWSMPNKGGEKEKEEGKEHLSKEGKTLSEEACQIKERIITKKRTKKESPTTSTRRRRLVTYWKRLQQWIPFFRPCLPPPLPSSFSPFPPVLTPPGRGEEVDPPTYPPPPPLPPTVRTRSAIVTAAPSRPDACPSSSPPSPLSWASSPSPRSSRKSGCGNSGVEGERVPGGVHQGPPPPPVQEKRAPVSGKVLPPSLEEALQSVVSQYTHKELLQLLTREAGRLYRILHFRRIVQHILEQQKGFLWLLLHARKRTAQQQQITPSIPSALLPLWWKKVELTGRSERCEFHIEACRSIVAVHQWGFLHLFLRSPGTSCCSSFLLSNSFSSLIPSAASSTKEASRRDSQVAPLTDDHAFRESIPPSFPFTNGGAVGQRSATEILPPVRLSPPPPPPLDCSLSSHPVNSGVRESSRNNSKRSAEEGEDSDNEWQLFLRTSCYRDTTDGQQRKSFLSLPAGRRSSPLLLPRSSHLCVSREMLCRGSGMGSHLEREEEKNVQEEEESSEIQGRNPSTLPFIESPCVAPVTPTFALSPFSLHPPPFLLVLTRASAGCPRSLSSLSSSASSSASSLACLSSREDSTGETRSRNIKDENKEEERSHLYSLLPAEIRQLLSTITAATTDLLDASHYINMFPGWRCSTGNSPTLSSSATSPVFDNTLLGDAKKSKRDEVMVEERREREEGTDKENTNKTPLRGSGCWSSTHPRSGAAANNCKEESSSSSLSSSFVLSQDSLERQLEELTNGLLQRDLHLLREKAFRWVRVVVPLLEKECVRARGFVFGSKEEGSCCETGVGGGCPFHLGCDFSPSSSFLFCHRALLLPTFDVLVERFTRECHQWEQGDYSFLSCPSPSFLCFPFASCTKDGYQHQQPSVDTARTKAPATTSSRRDMTDRASALPSQDSNCFFLCWREWWDVLCAAREEMKSSFQNFPPLFPSRQHSSSSEKWDISEGENRQGAEDRKLCLEEEDAEEEKKEIFGMCVGGTEEENGGKKGGAEEGKREERAVPRPSPLLSGVAHLLIGSAWLTPPVRLFMHLCCEAYYCSITHSYSSLLSHQWKVWKDITAAYSCGSTGERTHSTECKDGTPTGLLTSSSSAVLPLPGWLQSFMKEQEEMMRRQPPPPSSFFSFCSMEEDDEERSPSLDEKEGQKLALWLFPLKEWMAKVEAHVEKAKEVFQVVRRREEIIKGASELLLTRQKILDECHRLLVFGGEKERSSRLLNKKVNMAKQLLEEEKIRKRAGKELPMIMQKLQRLVLEWEGNRGFSFWKGGKEEERRPSSAEGRAGLTHGTSLSSTLKSKSRRSPTSTPSTPVCSLSHAGHTESEVPPQGQETDEKGKTISSVPTLCVNGVVVRDVLQQHSNHLITLNIPDYSSRFLRSFRLPKGVERTVSGHSSASSSSSRPRTPTPQTQSPSRSPAPAASLCSTRHIYAKGSDPPSSHSAHHSSNIRHSPTRMKDERYPPECRKKCGGSGFSRTGCRATSVSKTSPVPQRQGISPSPSPPPRPSPTASPSINPRDSPSPLPRRRTPSFYSMKSMKSTTPPVNPKP